MVVGVQLPESKVVYGFWWCLCVCVFVIGGAHNGMYINTSIFFVSLGGLCVFATQLSCTCLDFCCLLQKERLDNQIGYFHQMVSGVVVVRGERGIILQIQNYE